MRTHIFLNGEKLELEDQSVMLEVGKSILVENESKRTECFIKKIDTILIKSGKGFDVIQEVYLV